MTKDRWLRLLDCLALPPDTLSPDTETYDRLFAAYSQTHRKYHNVAHVDDCLAKLDAFRHLANEPDEVELAIWFHDAVYKPYSSSNEADSAEWASRFLVDQNAAVGRVERVHEQIMATLHDGRATSQDAALLADIDLSILGADAAEYQRFETAVREEYRWVPAFVYRQKRRAILSSFLERQQIYHHAELQARWEKRARFNLASAIAEL